MDKAGKAGAVELHFSPGRDVVTFLDAPADSPVRQFTTGAIEQLLWVLGFARRQMLPEVAKSWTPHTPLEGVQRDPAFMIETEALAGDLILHIRDGRFGWLHYVFSRADARAIAENILERCDAAPPPVAGNA